MRRVARILLIVIVGCASGIAQQQNNPVQSFLDSFYAARRLRQQQEQFNAEQAQRNMEMQIRMEQAQTEMGLRRRQQDASEAQAQAEKEMREKQLELEKLRLAPGNLSTITVRFASTPTNAEVDVDGVYWGTTPTADLKRLPAGAHTIVVKKIGYQPWERKIDLAAGDDRTINAELEAVPVDKTKPRISGLN
jgi:PEGA domain